MDRSVLAASDEAIKAVADEIAACACFYQEGDTCELLIELRDRATVATLAEIRDKVKGTGAELTDLRQDRGGVYVQVRVGVLPLFMIAVISLGALIPVGVIGWKLFRWGPEQMTRFLLPFALIMVGAATVIVRPRPATFIFGGALVSGGAYLALRKAPVPPEVRASITDFRWEKVTTPAVTARREYILAGRSR